MKGFSGIFCVIILLFCTNLKAQIPDSSFETWTNNGLYIAPEGWGCLNAATYPSAVYTCERGNTGYTGAYYLKLTTKTIAGAIVPGIAVSGVLDTLTYQPVSGFPYASRPLSFTGAWQFMSFGSNDTGYISVCLTRWNSSASTRDTVAYSKFNLPYMIMLWQTFSIGINYRSTLTPDSAIIVLSSSGNTPANKSYLYVDGLSFSDLPPTGIQTIDKTNNYNIYPNPASEIVNLACNSRTLKTITIAITDVTGRTIRSINPNINTGSNNIPINIAGIPKGMYLLKITDDENVELKKLTIE